MSVGLPWIANIEDRVSIENVDQVLPPKEMYVEHWMVAFVLSTQILPEPNDGSNAPCKQSIQPCYSLEEVVVLLDKS